LDFLRRNSISFPETVNLLYRRSDSSWTKSYHYVGLSDDGVTQERWDLLFQLSCTDEVGGQILNDHVWKYSAVIRRKNLDTGQDYQTKIVFAVENDRMCKDGVLGLSFSVDTDSGLVITNNGDILDYVFLTDEIQMFYGSGWVENPYLTITISETGAAGAWGRVDITPIFPEQPLPTPY
jgi:hypothetical protein